MTPKLTVRNAEVADAALVCSLIHRAFGGRPALDPPTTALEETPSSLAASIASSGGLIVLGDGDPIGSLLFDADGPRLVLRRVGVVPEVRHHGVARYLTDAAAQYAARHGFERLVLEARAELVRTVNFWQRQGYVEVRRDGPRIKMVRALALTGKFAEADDIRHFGKALASFTGRGDLLLLHGDLGAGKTTFAQGFGQGLGVRGPVTSPTFVIARTHPSLADGPKLVHVDAYRLPNTAELDDLDLDTDLEVAVTVIEWGTGIAEQLAHSRLEITLTGSGDQARDVHLKRCGPRWVDVGLDGLGLSPTAGPLVEDL